MITKSTPSPYATQETARPFFTLELKRLLQLAAGTALLLSLSTYHALDASWSTWSTQTEVHNWMGRLGSVGADILYQLFGLSAFAFVLILFFTALKRTPAYEVSSGKWQWVKSIFFIVATASLLQAVLPPNWLPWELNHAGGVIGKTLTQFFQIASGKGGMIFFSATLFLASTIVMLEGELLSLIAKVFSAILKSLSWTVGRIRSLLVSLTYALLRVISLRKTKNFLFSQAQATSIDYSISSPEPGLSPPESLDTQELQRLQSGDSKPPKGLFFRKRKPKRPPQTDGEFSLPPLSILSGQAEAKTKPIDKNWYIEKGEILIEKLKDFGVEGEIVNISPGPVITVYEFKPANGVKIKEIANLSDDLTLALSVLSVRIVAPIPGKPVVGIEIPTVNRETVYFKDLLKETPFFKEGLKIPVALGRLASGEPIAADLASMPHLLIAGTTGTGKSVFINTLIASLLYRFSPAELRLILVDPKMVELSHFDRIPHLLLPVVIDSKKAAAALRWVVEEMENRYSLMHEFGVRHLDLYNEKLKTKKTTDEHEEREPLPYIVVVIDEYADLMAVVPKDVELSITRLAQKARAAGIYIVLATQRPSTDVVTGTIKANFPSRLSFRVASAVDSKTILDRSGADRLLGKGDMLFHSAGFTTLKRMQAPFISDGDIEQVTAFLRAQGEPQYNENILRPLEEEETEGGENNKDSELYDTAVRLVTERGEASISLIQRHLRIGYNRAATLMEQLEKEGVVGASTGASKRRAVLVGSH